MKSLQVENELLKSKIKNLEDIVENVRLEEESRKKRGEDFIKECFKPSLILSAKKQ